MSAETPVAHSMVEAYLTLLVTPCPVCRHGAREVDPPEAATLSGRVRLRTTCTNCGATQVNEFEAPGDITPVDPISSAMPINPTSAPSRLIDVGQWLTLHGLMLSAAEHTPDARERRWCKVRAAQCLEEALKFYAEDSDVPPATAFFVEPSRRAFRDYPQRFTRARIVDLKAGLPTPDTHGGATARSSSTCERRAWWNFRRAGNGKD